MVFTKNPHNSPPPEFETFLKWLVFIFVVGLLLIMIISSAAASDKYDGDCKLNATVGRCADKSYTPTVPSAQLEPVSQNTLTVETPVSTGDQWGK